MNKAYLTNLAALRGIPALLVATLHFHFFVGPIVPYSHAGLLDKMYLMVDLFFILSGFIICYVYQANFKDAVTKHKYKGFLIARLARIYPLHLFTLLAEVLIFLSIALSGKFSILTITNQHLYRFDAIPIQMLFLQTVGIFNFDTWNAPAWSLSAEWWAYMLFPFLFLLFKKIGLKRWFIVSFLAIIGWLTIEFILAPLEPFLHYPPNPNHQTLDVNWHYGTLRGIVGFIAGMSIWMLYKESKFKALLGNGWTFILIVCSAALSMQYKFYDTVTVSLFSVLILSAAYGSRNIDKFFSGKIFNQLGKWSFSIYMWHMILIHIFMLFFMLNRTTPIKGLLRPLNGGSVENIIYLLIFLMLSCVVAYFSYRFIETPTRKWINAKYKK